MLYSTDAKTWNGYSSIFSGEGFSPSSGSMYVAVGKSGDNTLAYSYDGLVWVSLGKTIFSTRGGYVI